MGRTNKARRLRRGIPKSGGGSTIHAFDHTSIQELRRGRDAANAPHLSDQKVVNLGAPRATSSRKQAVNPAFPVICRIPNAKRRDASPPRRLGTPRRHQLGSVQCIL